MSAAEVIAQIEALPEAERLQVAQETVRHLGKDQFKAVARTMRRLAHPEIPDSLWDSIEDCEDGHTVDMETALFEEPPPHVLDRSLQRD